jgi:hypothetical protein
MTDELDNLTPAQIHRLVRARVGPPRQRLNAATQAAIDATLTRGDLRAAAENEKAPANDFNDYFRFGGD